MNANYFRMLISDEIRETIMWAGLAENYHDIRTKEIDSKGKTLFQKSGSLTSGKFSYFDALKVDF